MRPHATVAPYRLAVSAVVVRVDQGEDWDETGQDGVNEADLGRTGSH